MACPTETYDIIVKQGATYVLKIQLKDEDKQPINITGYTIKSEIRKSPGAATVEATFTPTITDAVNGQFELELDYTTTASLDFDREKYVYDVILHNPAGSGTRIRPLQGEVAINKRVTVL